MVRADKPGAVYHGRIQGNGVAQVFPVVDHFDDKGLPYRDIKGIDDAEEQTQHDNMPDLDNPGEDGGSQ